MSEVQHISLERMRQCEGNSARWYTPEELAHLRICDDCDRLAGKYDEALAGKPILAVTVHEPWATLLAWRKKKFEFRPWPCPGENFTLAIHVAEHADMVACESEPVRKTLHSLGIDGVDGFQRGRIIALVWVDRSYPIGELLDARSSKLKLNRIERLAIEGPDTDDDQDEVVPVTPRGHLFGWHISDVARVLTPVEAKDQPGIWEWVPPRRYLTLV